MNEGVDTKHMFASITLLLGSCLANIDAKVFVNTYLVQYAHDYSKKCILNNQGTKAQHD